MKNKIYYLIPIILFISVSSFIFGAGEWVYLDNRWYLFYTFFNNNILTEVLYGFNTNSYFGYDKMTIISARALNTLLTVFLGQKIIFLIYFIINFILSFLILKELFPKKSSIIGASFFTFNPISIHILNYSSFIFAYSSFVIFLYGVIKYYKKQNIVNLFFIALGFSFMISYIRITGLYVTLLIILGCFFYKEIFIFIKNKTNAFLISIFTIFLISSCLLFTFIYPKLNGDSNNFKGIGNYTDRSIEMSDKLYHKESNGSLLDAFVIEDIIKNFGTNLQKSEYYRYFMIYFLLFTIILAGLGNKSKNNLEQYLLMVLVIVIGFRGLGIFVSKETFTSIVFKYYPFLAGELKWIYIIAIPLLSYFISSNLHYNSNSKIGKVYLLSTTLVMALSITPLLGNWNISAKSIKESDIPIDYKDLFYNDENFRESTLFFPDGYYYNDGNINLNWTHNPIILGYNENYKPLLSNNYRLVNNKQATLWNVINKNKDFSYIENSKILGLDNIIIAKDAINTKTQYHWYYNNLDILAERDDYIQKLINKSNLYIGNETENLIQFKFKNNNTFFLYLPDKIIELKKNDFFKKKIDITKKPIIIDNESIGYDKINKGDILHNYSINYKKSPNNPTLIPFKITSNEGFDKNLVIHLNQTYGNAWKIKKITKDDYNNFHCLEQTSNDGCIYKNRIFSLKYLKLYFNDTIKTLHHFEGNFIGNTWIIPADELKSNGENEIFYIIAYEKQIYYFILLCISFLTIIFLFLLVLLNITFKYTIGKK